MTDTDSPDRGLGPAVGSLAFALGSLLALSGGTAFAAHVFRYVTEFDRLAFDDVFVPALAFVAGAAVAFGAFAGVLLRTLDA
ncbi:hypothetical protein [Halorussus sp. AFM4]|uniref:hypothetical protein n=1 Tax=Halorussus sp. AFM4 TaxID=3421651 RepID=UPI003EB695FD